MGRMPPSPAQQGLDRVLAGMVGQIARLFKKNGQEQKIATVDQDATIIESHKKSALLADNAASAIKSLCLDPEERTARFKRYRLLVIEIAGRMSRSQCKLRLRLHATKKTIGRIQKIWEVFDLPTQATAFS